MEMISSIKIVFLRKASTLAYWNICVKWMTPSGHVVDYPLSFTTFPNRDRNGIILNTSLINDFYTKELLWIWNFSSLSWNMPFNICGELLHTDNNERADLAGNCSDQTHVCKSKLCTQLHLGFCQIYSFLHVFKKH